MASMKQRPHQHLYPIMDLLIEKTVHALENEGCQITCQRGCAHCCHLLVEISWEEAVELAHWINAQPATRRRLFIEKITHNAAQARALFVQTDASAIFCQPVDDGDLEIPDAVFDNYFYASVKPCPFLEDNLCAAYTHRPSTCRLHMVNSPVALCMREADTTQEPSTDVEIPETIETLKQDMEPLLVGLIEDGRWGQLAIMVEAALAELPVTIQRNAE